MSKSEEDANLISDAVVKLANLELRHKTKDSAVVVGVCLGLLGVLGSNETDPMFTDLIACLHKTIEAITGENTKFYNSPARRMQ